MLNEKLTEKTTSYGLNIAGGVVDSLRVKEDLKTVVRVYDGGKIGIAGRIGEGDDGELLEVAKEKLALNIEYPCNLTENQTRSELTAKTVIKPTELVKTIKKLIARLNAAYPDFIFSNKINMEEYEKVYENSKNTKYAYSCNYLSIGLVIKYKASANIMDLFYGAEADYYDEDAIVRDIGKLLNVYSTKLPMPDEELPVIAPNETVRYALLEMVAEKYASGSSLFKDKLGEKIFSDKVSILTDRSPAQAQNGVSFFDNEGVVCKDDKFYYVKDGVFCGLATYKRSAEKLDLPLSGGGYSDFDSVPSASFMGVKVTETAEKLNDIIKGKAIYVVYTSGGDMTPDGTLGLPVQLAYLYDNGKLVGALPEFSLSANINDFFGKDFIGAAKNDVFEYCDEKVLVAKFKINKA